MVQRNDTEEDHRPRNHNHNNNKRIQNKNQTTTTTTTTRHHHPPLILDILSIGSVRQADLQQAQRDTFGRQARHFYAATEADDVERDCHTHLTWTHVERIVKRCGNLKQWYPFLKLLKHRYAAVKWLEKKKHPTAWMCAQKRPLQALRNMVYRYYYSSSDSDVHNTQSSSHQSPTSSLQLNVSSLPDYLMVGDDDTWINLPAVQSTLRQRYPFQEARAVAACLVRLGPAHQDFTFPFGGNGIVVTRPTLYNLLRPIHCSLSDTNYTHPPPKQALPPFSTTTKNQKDEFEALVCYRLQQNLIGELQFYRPGASLLDILYDYSVASPFLQVFEWPKTESFCLHSDWVWGYLFNYYHMADHSSRHYQHPTDKNTPPLPAIYNRTTRSTILHDRMEGYQDSQFLNLPRTEERLTKPFLGQCRHSTDFQDLLVGWTPKTRSSSSRNTTTSAGPGDAYCHREAHFCHRISPSHMRKLHRLQQQQQSHHL